MEIETCKHPLCACQVMGGETYCSPACASAAKRDLGEAASCECPHLECKDGALE